MDLNSLTAYFARERSALLESIHQLALLAPESLQQRGLALTDLTVVGEKHGQVALSGDCSNTRIRPGDNVEVISGDAKKRGTIVEITHDAVSIELSSAYSRTISGKVSIMLTRPTFYAPIFKSLRNLRRGTPGYAYASMLFGERPITLQTIDSNKEATDTPEMQAHALMPELDESQTEVVNAAFQRPQLLGIQGPPGTGKTKILALVSRLLTLSDNQTVITAYTHQAVNNALNETAKACGDTDIRMVKIGSSHRATPISDRVEVMGFKDFERIQSQRPKSKFVVGLTVHSGIVNLTLRQGTFLPDVLLVDEAGQIPFPLGILLGRFWAGSILLFGDDTQMPPVFSEALEYHPFSISLFAKLREVSPAAIKMLRTTYRLNGELTDIIGKYYYPGENNQTVLEATPPNKEKRLILENRELPSELNALLSGHSLSARVHSYPGQSTHNRNEAQEVAFVVNTLINSGIRSESIAIVSPFRRQCQLIRAAINQSRSNPLRQSIPITDTVERIQGMTVDLVIFSYGCSDSLYAGTNAEFLFSPNRLNVALSRARFRAIVFISKTVLTAEPDTYEGMLAFTDFTRLVMEGR